MKTTKKLLLAGTAVLTILVGGAALANSGGTTQAVKQVEYINSATPNLYLQLTDTINYQATAGYAPCSGVNAPNIDTVKIWSSLGQAALLSGKNVTIYWDDCGGSGTRWITDVVLTQ